MSDIDTTPPPPGKVQIDYSSLHFDEDRDFRHGRSELIDATSAFAKGLDILKSGDHPTLEQSPSVITFTGRLLNKAYRAQFVGAPDDLRTLKEFIELFHRLSNEREKANALSNRFEAEVKALREKDLLEARRRDSASARRGRRGISNGPATPLNWRQRTLLGYGVLRCTLLERLGALTEEGFARLGALKFEELIQLLEYKMVFPDATVDALAQLAA